MSNDAVHNQTMTSRRDRQVETLNSVAASADPASIANLQPTIKSLPSNGSLPPLPEIVVSFSDVGARSQPTKVTEDLSTSEGTMSRFGQAQTSSPIPEPSRNEGLANGQRSESKEPIKNEQVLRDYPSDAETLSFASSKVQQTMQRGLLTEMLTDIDVATSLQKVEPEIAAANSSTDTDDSRKSASAYRMAESVQTPEPIAKTPSPDNSVPNEAEAPAPAAIADVDTMGTISDRVKGESEEAQADQQRADRKLKIDRATESLVSALYDVPSEEQQTVSDEQVSGSQAQEPIENGTASTKGTRAVDAIAAEVMPEATDSTASSEKAIKLHVAGPQEASKIEQRKTTEPNTSIESKSASAQPATAIAGASPAEQSSEDTDVRTADSQNEDSANAEAELESQYKELVVSLLDRTNEFGASVMLFASSAGEVEASTVVRRVAIELAKKDPTERVLLIDGQAKQKCLTKSWGLSETEGLAEAINQGSNWERSLSKSEISNLDFLPAGNGILTYRKSSTKRLNRLNHDWKQKYRYVLVDAGESDSPLTQLWCPFCEATYLVFTLGETERYRARTAVTELQGFGARIMGCVATEPDSIQPRRTISKQS